MAKGSGLPPNVYREDDSNGGRPAPNRRRLCVRTRPNYCSPPAIPMRKPHRPGGPCRLEKESLPIRKKHLRSVFDSATLTTNARMEIQGPGSDSRRYRADSTVTRRESQGEPAPTFGSAVRGLAVETGQRRLARHGLPRLVAHAAPGRRDRVTAHPLSNAESVRQPRSSSADAHRYDARHRAAQRTSACRVAAGAAHRRRTAVQQSDGAQSLPGLRAAGG